MPSTPKPSPGWASGWAALTEAMTAQPGIRLFQTLEHACGYWPDRHARDVILDPEDPRLPGVYGQALALGFRRSGGHVYRPHCANCQACVPVRIPVASFVPNRSQRRCWQRNADLQITAVPARRNEANFALYRRYLASRHAGGGMDDPSEAHFDSFLHSPWSPTYFLEMREHGRLVAVAVTDRVPGALSAVYTFYAPELSARSLGTYAILQQIAWARNEGCGYLYLGFWLDGHPKMAYKQGFQPLQHRVGDQWLTFTTR